MSLVISGTGKRVAASANGSPRDAPRLVVEIEDSGGPEEIVEEAESIGRVLVRLFFLEPRAKVKPGDRVFDVAIGGEPVLSKMDVAAQAGGERRCVTTTWQGTLGDETLEVLFTPHSDLPPVLSGVEIIVD
jgi:hypothetical protein